MRRTCLQKVNDQLEFSDYLRSEGKHYQLKLLMQRAQRIKLKFLIHLYRALSS